MDQRWTTDFVKAYLPSSYDVVTAVIDGRGSAYEGDKFMHLLYKKLGQLEPIDQVDTARHILNTHPAIDPQRTAIYGWSYGGYATSHVLGYDAGNTFKVRSFFQIALKTLASPLVWSRRRSTSRLEILRYNLRRAIHGYPSGKSGSLPKGFNR